MARTAHLPAADADRERAASELGRHYAEGRLTAQELSERLEVVYSARTLGDLAEVARDLPAPPGSRRRRGRARLGLLGASALGVVCVVIAAGVLESAAQKPFAALAVLVLLILGAVLAVAVLLPALVALAPLVALVFGARWVARELGVGRGTRHLGDLCAGPGPPRRVPPLGELAQSPGRARAILVEPALGR
jgi:Domain of unknown function (DUF1707)